MSQQKVIKVSTSAAYRNGQFLFDNNELIADTKEFVPKQSQPGLRFVDIRFAIPSVHADDFLAGLQTGQVALTVDSMASAVERG